jgi:hypothetical protein
MFGNIHFIIDSEGFLRAPGIGRAWLREDHDYASNHRSTIDHGKSVIFVLQQQ